jgi:ornithine cyclodeaminase
MAKPLKVLFLSQQDVIDAGGKNMRAAIDDVAQAFSLFDKGDCVLPTKTSLRWGDEQSEIQTGRINAMPGYIGGDIKMAGIKWLGGSPRNPFLHGIPRASGLLVLNDPETMVPVAILEAALISAMRTGAVTGAGARHLARMDSKIVGLIGAGVQGRTQLMALKEAVPSIQEARVYDLDRERAEAFSKEMEKELGISVRAASGYQQCVEGADILVTAIVTNTPVLKNEWVGAGTFYAHVGSYECEFDVVSHSDKVVVDSWSAVVHRDVATLAKMHAVGKFDRSDLYAEIGEIENGKRKGRENSQERIMFAPIGFSLHDLIIGARVYREAEAKGLGKELVLYEQPVWA